MPLAWVLLDALARNWALVAIASTIAVLIAVPAAIIIKYVRISLNLMRSTKPPLSRSPLDFDPFDGEMVSFPAYDGLPLQGMVIRAAPGTPTRGLVVFGHEFCADMSSCARYCRPLHENGYDLLTFDFRGHGSSDCRPGYTPRQWVSNLDLEDMRGAVAFAQRWLEEQGRPPQVGVLGISRGAGAAILVAQEDPNVRAIVADGAYSTDTTLEYFMRRWAYIFVPPAIRYDNHPPAFWRFLRWCVLRAGIRAFGCRYPSVRKAIARMTPRPILFIHGEKDSYLPVDQSRRLYALAAQPKLLWVAAGARHNQAVIYHPDLYRALTVGFFDRYLAPHSAAQAPPAAAEESGVAAHRRQPAGAALGLSG